MHRNPADYPLTALNCRELPRFRDGLARHSAAVIAVIGTAALAFAAPVSAVSAASAPRPVPRAAPTWVVQTVPPPTSPNGNLWAVSCTSATACTAVGGAINATGKQVMLAERWNGTSWSIEAVPNPTGATGSILSAVSCTSATACTAVGRYTNSTSLQLTLAERWNGTSWSIQDSPNPPGAGFAEFFGLSCTSATACTGVGDYTNTTGTWKMAEGWNGTSWSIRTTPNAKGATASSLTAVSCTSASACTAVGNYTNSTGTQLTLAERWNGTSWSIQTAQNVNGGGSTLLDGVSCTSATTCTAVGDYTNKVGNPLTLAERWNGTSWSIQTTSNPKGFNSFFAAISCTSATACTAVGSSFNSSGGAPALAERWNGTSWSIQTTAPPTGSFQTDFYAVSCPSATACSAVGRNVSTTLVSGDLTGVTLAERWNGTGWSVQSTPNLVGARGSFLYASSCTSATACTAVGYYSVVFGPPRTLAERWNGTSWSVQATPNATGWNSFLDAVSCTSATDCMAVGSSFKPNVTEALAERWNGTSWSIESTPGPSGAKSTSLAGVSCPSAANCTAVGSYVNSAGTTLALAERWNGTSWSIETTPGPSGASSSSLAGVSCPSAANCTAVGSYVNSAGSTVVLAEGWNGTSWSIETTPGPSGASSSSLAGVSCPSATDCTAVGQYTNNGSVVTLAEGWNGTSWSIQATPNPAGSGAAELLGLSCTSATACTAVGSYFSLSHSAYLSLAEGWNGTSWSVQSTRNPAIPTTFSGVSCTSATACTAVGNFSNTGTNVPLAERYS
jgi:hypothetical protein